MPGIVSVALASLFTLLWMTLEVPYKKDRSNVIVFLLTIFVVDDSTLVPLNTEPDTSVELPA